MLSVTDLDRLFYFGPRKRLWKVIQFRGQRVYCMDVVTTEGCDLPLAEVKQLLDKYEEQKVTENPPY